jgi:hypothetical protein
MSFHTTFAKTIKTTTLEYKSFAQLMISNGCDFSCQCLNISAPSGDETIYPEASDLDKWLFDFFINDIKPKPINPRALEEMTKKGIKPKKQITELYLTTVVASNTHLHVAFYVPENLMSVVSPSDFITSALPQYKFDVITHNNYAFCSFPHPETLKEKEVVLQCLFNEFKKRKIYVVNDDDDEEIINYLDDQ